MPFEFWMGLLSTAFMVAFMLMAPLFGVLADRISSWKLMAFGVAVWSLASGASGLATSFVAMLLTRGVVGVGEAAYGPAAPAVLSDMYPVERRGSILAYFYVAIPVGSALGYVLGAVTLAVTHDWRWAFFAVVPPGLLLALLCLFMREPPRGEADPATRPHAAHLGRLPYHSENALVRPLHARLHGDDLRRRRHRLLGAALRQRRPHEGGDLFTVNLVFGGITVVAGLLSTLAGGWAGDALRRRFPGSYFLVSGAGMLLAFPLMLAVLVTPVPVGLRPDLPDRLLAVLQHRPGEHHHRQRDAPGRPRQRLRAGHPGYPPFRRRFFAAHHRLICPERARRPQRPRRSRRGGRTSSAATAAWISASASCR